jgi:hypothetical protein
MSDDRDGHPKESAMAQQRRMAMRDHTETATPYAATDAALQQTASAVIALSRSLDPRRSVRPRGEDLRSARRSLSAALEAISDAEAGYP